MQHEPTITRSIEKAINGKPIGGNSYNGNDDINGVFLLRKSLGLSQAKFAERFGFPLGTIRNWEQKNAKPDSAARIIINMIKIDPDGVAELVAKSKRLDKQEELME